MTRPRPWYEIVLRSVSVPLFLWFIFHFWLLSTNYFTSTTICAEIHINLISVPALVTTDYYWNFVWLDCLFGLWTVNNSPMSLLRSAGDGLREKKVHGCKFWSFEDSWDTSTTYWVWKNKNRSNENCDSNSLNAFSKGRRSVKSYPLEGESHHRTCNFAILITTD